MFTQSVASPPLGPSAASSSATSTAVITSAAAVVPSSATAVGNTNHHSSRRLRGLSYLRSYTHNHLLSRDHHGQQSSSAANGTGATSPPAAASSRTERPVNRLTRSVSYTPGSSSIVESSSPPPEHHNLNRLTLVSTGPAALIETPSDTSTTHTGASPEPSSSSSPPPLPSEPAPLSTVASADRAANDTVTPSSETGQPVLETNGEEAMTRSRTSTTDAVAAAATTATITSTMTTSPPLMSNGNGASAAAAAAKGSLGPDGNLPSIRFSAYYDPRATRPSLAFSPVSRTLPTGGEIIKVGRYSERDAHPIVQPGTPSSAPVGFKSKVVSRRHCEFWYELGKWYIRDVKSSSGTFLNHIRLSPPGQESKPYALNDGDIVQLGIDFKGGEEAIFRCVKMRLELNRGWQNKPNAFNMSTHKRLRTLTANGANNYSQDCSICLNSIAPCQCLFVAPCSHTWHYKCIRSLLQGPSFPIFICPNCRATADLEAEVDDPSEEWQRLESEGDDAAIGGDKMDIDPPPPAGATSSAEEVNGSAAPAAQPEGAVPRITEPRASTDRRSSDRRRSNGRKSSDRRASDRRESELGDTTIRLDTTFPDAVTAATTNTRRPSLGHQVSEPIPIGASGSSRRTPSPNAHPLLNGQEGPITPRNDAGPWVFDGSAGRGGDAGVMAREALSLNAAAEMGAES